MIGPSLRRQTISGNEVEVFCSAHIHVNSGPGAILTACEKAGMWSLALEILCSHSAASSGHERVHADLLRLKLPRRMSIHAHAPLRNLNFQGIKSRVDPRPGLTVASVEENTIIGNSVLSACETLVTQRSVFSRNLTSLILASCQFIRGRPVSGMRQRLFWTRSAAGDG